MRKIKNLLFVLLTIALFSAFGSALAEGPEVCYGELFSHGDIPTLEAPLYAQKSDLEAFLVEHFRKQSTEMDVRAFNMTPDEFYTIYWNTLNEHPELFYARDVYWYYHDDGIITKVLPGYLYTGEELERRIAAFEASVDEVVAYANESTTDVGRLLRANDYMCMYYEYDLTYEVSSPDQFFAQHKGICQAYMMAFRAVLDEMGFTSTYVSSNEMNHTWNVVLLDGSWYHIDVTWDDPISDLPLRTYHNHFLRSDEGITETGHYGWNRKVIANNDQYEDAFWLEVNSPVYGENDKLYYHEYNSDTSVTEIRCWQDGSSTLICSLPVTYGSYWRVVAGDGHRLYFFDDDTMYSVEMDGSDFTKESDLQIAENEDVYSAIPIPEKNQIKLALTSWNAAPDRRITIIASRPRAVTITKENTELIPGGTAQMQVAFTPAYSKVPYEWCSDDESVVRISEDGTLSAVSPGITTIRVRTFTGLMAEYDAVVHYTNALRLPHGLTAVSQESFSHTFAREVILPDAVTAIGARAFGDCGLLKMILIPSSVTDIDPSALEGSEQAIVLCRENSAAHLFAEENGLAFSFAD